eukprot:118941-Rhodomonas_salina.2
MPSLSMKHSPCPAERRTRRADQHRVTACSDSIQWQQTVTADSDSTHRRESERARAERKSESERKKGRERERERDQVLGEVEDVSDVLGGSPEAREEHLHDLMLHQL